MKPIERGEVLGIAEYESIRDRFRQRVIQEKKLRRIAIGPLATAVFENRDTVLLQIQEMLRTERITREASILHEIETYNQLVPTKNELSCTMMIEIDDRSERESFLQRAAGLEKRISIQIGDSVSRAVWDSLRGPQEDRTTAVHYLKFPLAPEAAARLAGDPAARGEVAFVIDHPAYKARAALPAALVNLLAEEVSE